MLVLEYVLKLYNKTQQELAEQLGIKQQNIDAWVKGKRKIPEKHLPKLKEIFNVSQEYFQKDTDEVENLVINNGNINISFKQEFNKIEDINTTIGLEYILIANNMQQKELAEELGISKQIVNYWMKKIRPIPKKYLPRLSELFNLPEEVFKKEINIDKINKNIIDLVIQE